MDGIPDEILASHVDGTVTYNIFGAITVGPLTGYTIMRVTDDNITMNIDHGFLLESDRYAGANGSAALVNLKTDKTNTLLLLKNIDIHYA